MSIVNAREVWYILAREASESEADGAVTNLRQLGIQLVDADWRLNRLQGPSKPLPIRPIVRSTGSRIHTA